MAAVVVTRSTQPKPSILSCLELLHALAIRALCPIPFAWIIDLLPGAGAGAGRERFPLLLLLLAASFLWSPARSLALDGRRRISSPAVHVYTVSDPTLMHVLKPNTVPSEKIINFFIYMPGSESATKFPLLCISNKSGIYRFVASHITSD